MPGFAAFLDDWLDAKKRGDAEAVRDGLSRHAGALAIGTEPGEWWAGPDRFAEAHAADGPLPVQIERVDAHEAGNAGWAAVVASFEGIEVRVTVVALREDGAWKVVQTHASVGA